MKIRFSLFVPVLLILSVLFMSCEKPEAPSLYDYDYQSPRPQPQLTNIDPPEWWFAGIGRVTLTGTNFSPNIGENFVYFNTTRGTVLEASPTQLVVRPPNLVSDDIKIKVAVIGAELYSEPISYKLEAAVIEFGNLGPLQVPWGLAVDAEDNLYVSMNAPGDAGGIKKISTVGVQSDYAPRQTWYYISMKIGPDGGLYCARGPVPILYRVDPGGGAATSWASGSGLGRIFDFDFDPQGNIWAGGNNTSLFRITPERAIQAFPFNYDVRAVRVYDGYLYVSAATGANIDIMRMQIISADELGEPEIYYQFSANYTVSNVAITAMTFANNGDLFIGTNGPDPILVLSPNKTLEPLYPGVLLPGTVAFAWGADPYLYVSREERGSTPARILRVHTQREGAPYYGID
jgi:hypothetical protein